ASCLVTVDRFGAAATPSLVPWGGGGGPAGKATMIDSTGSGGSPVLQTAAPTRAAIVAAWRPIATGRLFRRPDGGEVLSDSISAASNMGGGLLTERKPVRGFRFRAGRLTRSGPE